jgi:hypothetical protein
MPQVRRTGHNRGSLLDTCKHENIRRKNVKGREVTLNDLKLQSVFDSIYLKKPTEIIDVILHQAYIRPECCYKE